METTPAPLNQVPNGSRSPNDTPNSLLDVDSVKLISETNKSLSNLLLDAESQNEISEQTDSGICTVTSSENTSLYDKSPEEKKTFVNEIDQSDNLEQKVKFEIGKVEEDEQEEEEENTSYSCSNLNSPQRRDSNKSDNPCVCSSRVLKPPSCRQNGSRITSNIESSNEEIIGVAYGSGQIPVCDGNHQQPNFQISYTENWENLKLNIEASTSRPEFWNELKCEEKIHQAASRKDKQRRRHHRRKYEQTLNLQQCDNPRRRLAAQPTSTESSRSNSIDRCNPRLVNFGSSLHPSQNSRQMPSFGACSPRASPRMQHFEQRAGNRKLLDHRRSRSEQQRLKRRDNAKRAFKLDHFRRKSHHNHARESELINDGLGPRTNKSGIVSSSTQGNLHDLNSSSSCSSCCGDSSSETSEFQSDCQDDEEIALAMQAAEIANRNQIRAKFR